MKWDHLGLRTTNYTQAFDVFSGKTNNSSSKGVSRKQSRRFASTESGQIELNMQQKQAFQH